MSNGYNKNNSRGARNNHKKSESTAELTKSERGRKPQGQGGQKKVGINARNDRAKYSDDEIARARYVDSKAKFLVRDRIHNENIDTRNKWIAINNLEVKDGWDSRGRYDPEILSFDAEIFDRTEQPEYTEDMDEEEKHKLTYEVAEGDIHKQRAEEKRTRQVVERPSYHVDVATKRAAGHKTEYQVKNIKRKK